MNEPSGFPWKTLLIIFVILMTLCCCLALIGGGVMYYMAASDMELPEGVEFNFNLGGEDEQPAAAVPVVPATQKPIPTKPALVPSTAEPAVEPPVVEEPAAEEPAMEEPAANELTPELTGNQERSDYRIFDDFSSNALNWDHLDEGEYSVQIENDALKLHIYEANASAWVEFPVSFIPHEIVFDVTTPSGIQDGTFGVSCNDLDDENFYYVEFKMESSEYMIMEIKEDEKIPLTKETADDYFWVKTRALKTPPKSTNKIAVSCYPGNIDLFINDKLIDQVTVENPLEASNTGFFFVYAFEDADENGYEISIDNVEIYQPVQ